MNMRRLRQIVTDPKLNPGFTWNKGKSGHIIVRNAEGVQVASLSGSPSSGRSINHSIADLRRGGVKIPRKGQS